MAWARQSRAAVMAYAGAIAAAAGIAAAAAAIVGPDFSAGNLGPGNLGPDFSEGPGPQKGPDTPQTNKKIP